MKSKILFVLLSLLSTNAPFSAEASEADTKRTALEERNTNKFMVALSSPAGEVDETRSTITTELDRTTSKLMMILSPVTVNGKKCYKVRLNITLPPSISLIDDDITDALYSLDHHNHTYVRNDQY